MKIKCEFCNENITKEVIFQFGHYQVGQLQCPHCNKKNKRYLSQLDILLYYSFSAVLYAAALMLTITLMNLYGSTIPVILFTLLIVSILFILMNLIATHIYSMGWLKKEWKNHIFDEDEKQIAKKGKREFWIIMLVAFVFATQKQLLAFYPAVILCITLFLFIQIMILVSNEKDILKKKD